MLDEALGPFPQPQKKPLTEDNQGNWKESFR